MSSSPRQHAPPAEIAAVEPGTTARDAAETSPERGGGASALALRAAAIVVLLVATYGLAARLYLIASGRAQITPELRFNIFQRLYALHEQPFLWLLAAFALITLWCAARGRAWPGMPWLERAAANAAHRPLWPVALAVLAVTAAGTLGVMHGIGLSMDEFGATFQARIFASGRVTAPIPEEWRPLAPWMTPIFITLKPELQAWVSSYLPVYAGLRAAMSLLHAEWLTNPLLAAASVLLLHAVARRLWPSDDRRPLIAVALLVTSSQFLVMSMSGYSMPAHLCLNLLWLWLYLRGDRAALLALPVLGVLAMGLHNPFPHALFVAPFLLRILQQRRWGWLAYMGSVYLAGSLVWLRWLAFSAAPPRPGAPPTNFLASFALPDASARFTNALNLSLVFSWQTPLLAMLVLVALFSWRRLARHERDLAAGVLLTFGFYLLFPTDQGHGWGYRYIYGALGNLMLLAASGGMLAWAVLPRGVLPRLLAASLAVSVLVQLPLRAWQTEAFVRPYARAFDFLERRPAPVVAVDATAGWYAWDLLRNDPLFERGSRVFAYQPRSAPRIERIPPAYRDSILVLSRRELAHFGIPLIPAPAPPSR